MMMLRLRWAALLQLVSFLWTPPATAQGRVITETLHARTLEGNAIGDSPDRAITVYLPPSYDRDSTRRFPVVYLLHGATSDPKEWLDGTYQGLNLAAALDARAADAEFIVVMPHADNRFGGSFYVNSAAFGRWDDFISTELVQFTDTRFRTIRARESRALVGQSMGGFGALSVARRHSNVFGHVYAMSPCCLGLVADLGAASDKWRSATRGYLRPLAMALATSAPRGADGRASVRGADSTPPLPFHVGAGGALEADSAVLRAWRAQLPLDLLEQNATPFRSLCTIALEAGDKDAITNVTAGAAAFSRALTRAGIAHRFEVFDGGHTDRTRERFETVVLSYLGGIFRARRSSCPALRRF